MRWLEADLRRGPGRLLDPRSAGVSEAPFDSLNLGVLTDDDGRGGAREPAAARRARSGSIPSGSPIGLQVHGAELAVHHGPAGAEPLRASPAPRSPRSTVTSSPSPGLAPLVFVADCLPVALPGRAGWRCCTAAGAALAAGIVARGAAAVEATAAAIGPGIGPCCYEVGEEVLGAVRRARRGHRRAGGMLDLAEVARRLLRQAGVERVETAGLCTSCEPELFFSHRRDAGRTGRQAGIAWLERRRARSVAEPIHGIDPASVARQPRAGAAPRRRAAPRSSSPASTCRWRRWARWPRPG